MFSKVSRRVRTRLGNFELEEEMVTGLAVLSASKVGEAAGSTGSSFTLGSLAKARASWIDMSSTSTPLDFLSVNNMICYDQICLLITDCKGTS